ncbi:MAG: Trk family potassium uptake protein [Clostridia bacterium]|nr:Trk family potassium uptake protein [Clostridia bacterium]
MKLTETRKTRRHRMTHVQIIVMGFLIMVISGTALLMLPCASGDGRSAGLLTSLFTATSAACVTGLIRRSTSEWSFFGQLVLLILIQTGGLGFMTIASMFFRLINRRMGLWQRETMVESLNLSKVKGIMEFTRGIIAGTAVIELAGAFLFSIRFVPLLGWGRGLWYSLFHSVSAFCNAGFDLMGDLPGDGSLTYFAEDWLVNLTAVLLITVGGLGYLVWDDLKRHRLKTGKYSAHTRMVLTVNTVLLFGGAIMYFVFESSCTGQGETLPSRAVEALFASATARTAGFNSVSVAGMSGASRLLTILLMFVGGSPGSTAGGIKTTTAAVLLLSSISSVRGSRRPAAFGRSISDGTVRKATHVFFLNLSLAAAAAVILCALQPLDPTDAFFETISAVSTVGITAGITGSLHPVSACIIALLMFIGRVGSVSFAVALAEKHKRPPVSSPAAEILIG